MTASSPAPDAHGIPGWYGKLASLGDFAQRRLPAQWLEACDAWLSAALRSSREQLGERWLEVYLTAPLLRFAWAPGVIDGQWWFGLLMPSCDSVGRYFPLLIAHARANAPQDRIGLDHLELWYDHLAHAAMHTLNDMGGSVESLESALHDAPPWPAPARVAALPVPSGMYGERVRLVRNAALSQWLHALAAREMTDRLAGCTLWWRVAEAGAEGSIDIVRGLPQGAGFVALLSRT